MSKERITQLINSKDYGQAVTLLEDENLPTLWRDTMLLRTLRAWGNSKDAVNTANSLYDSGLDLELPAGHERARYVALVFAEQGQSQRACEILSELVKQSPSTAALQREYSFALSQNNQFGLAIKHLNLCIDLSPTNAGAFAQLGRLYCRTGQVEKGYRCFEQAACNAPGDSRYLMRLSYWANYLESTSQRDSFHLASLWANRAFPTNVSATNTWRTANPDRRLKIGFVSGDFLAHAISFFVLPLFASLNRDDLEVYVYSDVSEEDQVTAQIKAVCDEWYRSNSKSDKQLAAQIAAHEIDVLVDLSGHTGSNRMGLFANQVAPIQLSWLGYPSTTGLKSIHYRISDSIADPATDNTKYYSEKVVHLPGCFLCYQPHANAPDYTKNESDGGIRFGSFNNLAKFSPATIDLWASVLTAVDGATLYIKRQQLIDEHVRQYYIDQFAQRGIDPKRLILKTSKAKIEQHLAEYQNIDIALDTYPYNGTTTTFEALWMATPVITLTGDTHASRVSKSILSELNESSLCANDKRGFVNIAARLANDPDRLSSYHTTLRQRMQQSSLTDQDLYGDRFRHLIRQLWQQWCGQQNEQLKTGSLDGYIQ